MPADMIRQLATQAARANADGRPTDPAVPANPWVSGERKQNILGLPNVGGGGVQRDGGPARLGPPQQVNPPTLSATAPHIQGGPDPISALMARTAGRRESPREIWARKLLSSDWYGAGQPPPQHMLNVLPNRPALLRAIYDTPELLAFFQPYLDQIGIGGRP